MSYERIFWRNSSDRENVFVLQKKVIRIMTGVQKNDSCRGLFHIFLTYYPLCLCAYWINIYSW